MSDPRNVQHDKKVIEEKKHHGEDLTSGPDRVLQPGKKNPGAGPRHDATGAVEHKDHPGKAGDETAKGK